MHVRLLQPVPRDDGSYANGHIGVAAVRQRCSCSSSAPTRWRVPGICGGMTIPAQRLLDVRRLWAEPAALDTDRGRQVRSRFPDAEVIEVASHWQIPELHGNEGNLQRWVRVKSEDLVVGTKKSIATRVNGRSADFIAPSTSNGCAMACVYCYVPRRKGYANPITVFTNIEAILAHLRRHVAKQGVKPEPNQCDPAAWVYDLGENSDCSVDALVSENVTDLITAFRQMPTAKASFATSTSIESCWPQIHRDAPGSASP